eukprot:6482895-Amphidinium_carterae.2
MPVTPPAIAGAVTQTPDDMDVGEPDNPMAITELVEHPMETSTTTRRQVDVMRVNLRRQQLDVTHEEQQAIWLHQEYLQTVAAMESTLSLRANQELLRLEQQSQEYYRSTWS